MSRLSTTDISDRIGLTMTVKFITDVLGVPFRESEKKARFWYEDDYPTICESLAAYSIARKANPLVAALQVVSGPPPAAAPAAADAEDLSILD